jgi:cytochrome bd-type quinol oxidase subunit 2
MDLYPWIVLLHIVGAFLFVIAHGASIWAVNAIRRESQPARIAALADVSSMSLGAAYIGLLLILVGGIWAGIYGSWFSKAWIWVALVVFIAIAVAMYAIATPYFKRLRIALGQRTQGLAKDAPDPVPAPDSEVAAIAASAPAAVLDAVGFIGLVVILWLMVVKPF